MKQPENTVPQITSSDPTQLIYADRILNFSIGPGVVKLTLGLETGINAFTAFGTLIMPTHNFLEALEHIHKTVRENAEIKTNIIKGMDAVKAQLDKTKK